MAGLYIHIPFCRSKCAYCDFFSLPLNSVLSKRPSVIEDYCRAVGNEFGIRKNEVDEPIRTIYVGGGTPTAMPADLLIQFLSTIKTEVDIHNAGFINRGDTAPTIEEFTIEANPEDISMEMIDRLRWSGVDRISIGIQSFDNCQLHTIMRRHGPDASLKALSILRQSGINYSADLIYGLPGQNLESWNLQLNTLMDFEPPHFSAYLLSYEPGTLLYARKENGKVSETDEETVSKMYDRLISTAAEHGYSHYEISNFSKPGYGARHNSSYWNLTPYIGLGCSAHSFDGNQRRINPIHLKHYLAKLSDSSPSIVATIEEETTINKINDYIITSLRTSTGISPQLIREKWGGYTGQLVLANISQLYAEGKLVMVSNNYRIPENLWLTSDAILREIILDPE